jgi:hypothetical protein
MVLCHWKKFFRTPDADNLEALRSGAGCVSGGR